MPRGLRPGVARLSWEERFWLRVEKSEVGCWLWQGGRGGSPQRPYGVYFWPGQRRVGAHRIAYALTYGSVPEGSVVHHLCNVTLCVRPDHLVATTQAINNEVSASVSAGNAAKTHCPQGHAYDEENTYWHRGKRACWTCLRARELARRPFRTTSASRRRQA
jgi:hypothetical protein